MEGEEGFEGALDLFPAGYCTKAVEPQLSGKNMYSAALTGVKNKTKVIQTYSMMACSLTLPNDKD